MRYVQKLGIIFLAALVLNFLWEHLHSTLYLSYKGTTITSPILLHAALFDAALITLFSFPFLRFEQLKQKRWILYITLIIFSILLEKWALASGRWVYADAMPLISLLNVGLTPTIQLWLTGYFTLKFFDYRGPHSLRNIPK